MPSLDWTPHRIPPLNSRSFFPSMLQCQTRRLSWSASFAFEMLAPVERVANRPPLPRQKLRPLSSHPCPPSRPHQRREEITEACRHSQTISPNFYPLILQAFMLRHVLLIKRSHIFCLPSWKRPMPPYCCTYHLLRQDYDSSQVSPRSSCETLFPPNNSPVQIVRAAAMIPAVHHHLSAICPSCLSIAKHLDLRPTRTASSRDRPRCPWQGCHIGFGIFPNAPLPPDWPSY